MKAILPLGTAIVAAVAIAGCGTAASSSSTTGGSAARSTTVSARQIAGTGSVLVDAKGAALYAPAQEHGAMIKCMGSCTSVWKPLTLAKGQPTGPGHLGVVTRPDGTRQVTDNGHPLYSFAPDSPGKVTGNGAHDAFGGQHFTWHVITASGAASTAAPKPAPSSGGGFGY
jgi:predicted lipoprotein with Yx(FWY)xxD motif